MPYLYSTSVHNKLAEMQKGGTFVWETIDLAQKRLLGNWGMNGKWGGWAFTDKHEIQKMALNREFYLKQGVKDKDKVTEMER